MYMGPSKILMESDDTYVITPINPVTEGHVLVIPFKHVSDASVNIHLTGATFRDAAEYARTKGIESYNLITSVGVAATQTVGHLHVHLVPRRDGDGLKLPWSEA